MRTSHLLPLAILSLLVACGGDDRPAGDGGSRVDGSTRLDGSAPSDGPASDGGGGIDAPADDSATPTDGGGCGELLKPCAGGTGCAAGYECHEFHNVCVPSDRPGCGGFAGALCMTSEFPECLYYQSADFGPCLSSAEATCACGTAAGRAVFACAK